MKVFINLLMNGLLDSGSGIWLVSLLSIGLILLAIAYLYSKRRVEAKVEQEVQSRFATLIADKQRAEASNHAKGRFLAEMSHEIRTPLNSILGFAEVLSHRDLDAESRGFAKLISASGDSLHQLLNDILDLNKMEEGMLCLETLSFNFREVISSTVLPYEYIAREKGIQFDLIFDPEIPPYIIADPHRLRQILVNLIGNALKFTHEGKIRMHFYLEKKSTSTAYIKAVVTDTGIGVTHEKQESIFKTFTQMNEKISREYGGSGLGLTIAEQLINLMGGTIGVSSPSEYPISAYGGPGADFWFRVPLKIDTDTIEAETHREDLSEESFVLQNAVKILIAEDNAVNQVLFETILESMGAEVHLTSNGVEALDCLREDDSYDMVFMDVQMPVMDGLAATRVIRQELHMDIPIIGATANAFKEDIAQCKAAGMNDFLPKPFKQKDLYQKIVHWASRTEQTSD